MLTPRTVARVLKSAAGAREGEPELPGGRPLLLGAVQQHSGRHSSRRERKDGTGEGLNVFALGQFTHGHEHRIVNAPLLFTYCDGAGFSGP